MLEKEKDFEVSFGGSGFVPVRLPRGANMSEHLSVANSPLLFGCRTGICGTCLSRVVSGAGTLPPPAPDESELLSLLAPGNPKARLACQLPVCADLDIEPLKV